MSQERCTKIIHQIFMYIRSTEVKPARFSSARTQASLSSSVLCHARGPSLRRIAWRFE
jgi:hypothetical protein